MTIPTLWPPILAAALIGDGCVPRTLPIAEATPFVFCRPGDCLILPRPGAGYQAAGVASRIVHGGRFDAIEVRASGFVAYFEPGGRHRRTRVICVRRGY